MAFLDEVDQQRQGLRLKGDGFAAPAQFTTSQVELAFSEPIDHAAVD